MPRSAGDLGSSSSSSSRSGYISQRHSDGGGGGGGNASRIQHDSRGSVDQRWRAFSVNASPEGVSTADRGSGRGGGGGGGGGGGVSKRILASPEEREALVRLKG